MPEFIHLPAVGDVVTSAKIKKWYKNEGDKVKKDELICEINTSKLVVELESPASGELYKIFAPVEAEVEVGKVIGIVQLEGEELSDDFISGIKNRYISVYYEREVEKTASETHNRKAVEKKKIKASPVAKVLAKEKGIPIEEITGTGPNGRITKDDVLNYLEKEEEVKKESTDNKTIIKLEGTRKIIAERLRESSNTKPHINMLAEVSMDAVIQFRAEMNKRIKETITLNSFIMYTVVKALLKHPNVNANLIGDEIHLFKNINLGMAVGRREKGLIVPVIKNADKLSLTGLNQEIKKLSELALKEKLEIDHITGGTFTVSNLGMFGIKTFNAIINPPEVAILAVGAIIEKPTFINDEVKKSNMMNINLAVDHSVIDGDVASECVMTMKEILENPSLLLC